MQDLNERLTQIEQAITNHLFLADHYNKNAKIFERQATLLEVERAAVQQQMQQTDTQPEGETVNE